MNKEEVVSGVSDLVVWWIEKRKQKLVDLDHETMAINPFLAPLMLILGDGTTVDDLVRLLLAGHFSVGHATGFGKLIDEKILPSVFGTTKLTKAFRKQQQIYSCSMFDEIDHLVKKNDQTYLLSLKASRWTVQLTMAVQLNHIFAQLLEAKEKENIEFENIVVGVFYGTQKNLTDKYDIIKGVNRGANHSVKYLPDVHIHVGKNFWSWINQDQEETQEWVMEGILNGISSIKNDFKENKINWLNILHFINK